MSPVLKIFLITCFVCVFLAPAFAIKYQDCGSALASISEISVSNCIDSPCIFERGTTVNVSITFVPKVEITKTKIQVWGLWSSFSFPFPLPNSNGCKNSGLTCPLKPNVPATYHVQLAVKKIYPSFFAILLNFNDVGQKLGIVVFVHYNEVSLIAKWKMVDEDKQSAPVFCFEVGVKLK